MRVGDNSIGLYIDEMEQTVDELIKKESNEEVNIGDVVIMHMFHAICVVFLTITFSSIVICLKVDVCIGIVFVHCE